MIWIRVAAAILLTALIVDASAENWLRPDTQEPRCAAKSDEKLAECLRTCDSKPDTTATICRKHCLDEKESARKSCDKKGGFEIKLPGT